MTFIGFIVLLTLRCIGWRCPSDGAGASFELDRVERSDLSIS